MAAKRKCKYCGVFGYDHIRTPAGSFCDFEHAIKWGSAKSDREKAKSVKASDRAEKKKHAARKRTFYDNDIKTRKAAAKLACHAYIRSRDRNELCICCNLPLGDNFHAGHYLESGNNPKIRYDPNNINGQRLHCNVYRGGDSGDYKENLIKKIGVFEYWCLQMKKGGLDTRTAQDYKAIELHYKAKLKELPAH